MQFLISHSDSSSKNLCDEIRGQVEGDILCQEDVPGAVNEGVILSFILVLILFSTSFWYWFLEFM